MISTLYSYKGTSSATLGSALAYYFFGNPYEETKPIEKQEERKYDLYWSKANPLSRHVMKPELAR